ncbi:MAG: SPOR domain-containing protein [Marivibrio sp.]|uniref:SPOR domain-containing protein n=1 Tax=Marivibrio sp. TaxID=2039719 RepID=UPI0032EAE18F
MAAASMGGGEQVGDGGGGRWRPVGASAPRPGILGVLDLAGRDWRGARDRAPRFERAAYEEAPRIRHGGEALRVALSPRAAYGVIGGAAAAALLLFVAGFLAAFWLIAPDGGVARAPATQAPTDAGVAAVEPAAPAAPSARIPALIARATAGDAPETPAPPAPEILAAAERGAAFDQQSAGARSQVAALPRTSETVAPEPAQSDLPASATGAPRALLKRLPPAVRAPSAPPEQEGGFTASPSARPAPAETAQSEPSGGYALQFGAFRERANAEELLARIPDALDARIVDGRDSAGRALFYVRAGGFDSVGAARDRAAELETAQGLKSFVRRGRDG